MREVYSSLRKTVTEIVTDDHLNSESKLGPGSESLGVSKTRVSASVSTWNGVSNRPTFLILDSLIAYASRLPPSDSVLTGDINSPV
jgi:hypothetical protein